MSNTLTFGDGFWSMKDDDDFMNQWLTRIQITDPMAVLVKGVVVSSERNIDDFSEPFKNWVAEARNLRAIEINKDA